MIFVIISPLKLPVLAEESFFFDASMTVANEAFNPFAGLGHKASNKIEDMANYSADQYQKVCIMIENALKDYEHNFFESVNTVMGKLFAGNKERVASLSQDLNKMRADAKKMEKILKDKGIPSDQKAATQTEYEELQNRMEQTKDLINELKIALFVTPETYNALQDCLSKATQMIQMLNGVYVKYKDGVAILEDPTHFSHFGKFEDKYDDAIAACLSSIDITSDTYKKINEVMDEITRISETHIYGKMVGTFAKPADKMSSKVTSELSNQVLACYQQFKKKMKWVHEHLYNLRRDAILIGRGKNGKVYDAKKMANELQFLVHFLTLYNGVVVSYMRFPMAIINATSK